MARWTSAAQVDRAIELLRSGTHPIAAAQTAGMSETALYSHLRRRGLTAHGTPRWALDARRPPTERRAAERARRDEALALRERGLTFAEMAADLGVTQPRA